MKNVIPKLPLALSLLLLVCGCNLFNQHSQMMDAMRGVMADTASRLGESGNGQIAAGGQVINPGIRVAGGMEYYAVAQYEGVAGQVTASMQGQLDRPVPADVQDRINRIWQRTGISSDEKWSLIRDVIRTWLTNQPTTQPSS